MTTKKPLSSRKNYAEMSETEVIALAKEPDPEAFGELYKRYVDRIYSFSYYHLGGDHHAAEDITSRTFFQALDNITRYNDRGAPFSAWLYRIAHNLIANSWRTVSRHPSFSFEDQADRLRTPARYRPEQVVEQRAIFAALRDAIDQLDPDERTLIILKLSGETNNREIGEVLGRTESGIKSLYHRTLLKLREILKDKGWDHY